MRVREGGRSVRCALALAALAAGLISAPRCTGEDRTPSAIAAPVLKWQRGGCFASWCQTGWYSSPAVVDLDGDGVREIVIVGNVYKCGTDPYTSVYQMPFVFRLDRTRASGAGWDWTVLPAPEAARSPRNTRSSRRSSRIPRWPTSTATERRRFSSLRTTEGFTPTGSTGPSTGAGRTPFPRPESASRASRSWREGLPARSCSGPATALPPARPASASGRGGREPTTAWSSSRGTGRELCGRRTPPPRRSTSSSTSTGTSSKRAVRRLAGRRAADRLRGGPSDPVLADDARAGARVARPDDGRRRRQHHRRRLFRERRDARHEKVLPGPLNSRRRGARRVGRCGEAAVRIPAQGLAGWCRPRPEVAASTTMGGCCRRS